MTTRQVIPTGVILGPVAQLDPGSAANGDLLTVVGGVPAFAPPSTSFAPGSAEYLVKTANGSLSAERVVTDTGTVTWDWSTAGQAKANVISSVGWWYQQSLGGFGTGTTDDVFSVATSHGSLLITVAAYRLAYRGVAHFLVPLGYTGSSPWLVVRPYASNAGAAIQLEVQINSGSTSIRVRNESGGNFDGTTVTAISLNDSAPTWTALAASNAAITTTALFGNERTRLAALEQAGATNGQAIIWNNTTLAYEPGSVLLAASPALTGVPTAPTAAAGNNSTQIATTAYVDTGLALKANIASPTFTGTPAAPTAAAGNNSTQLATTAYVDAAVTAGGISPAGTILAYDGSNSQSTVNPHAAAQVAIANMSASFTLASAATVLIRVSVRAWKNGGCVLSLYDNGSLLAPSVGGGADPPNEGWYMNDYANERNNLQITFEYIASLASGAHAIVVRSEASQNTNSITYSERVITVTQL